MTKKPVSETVAVIEDSHARIAHCGPGFAHSEAEYICADQPVISCRLQSRGGPYIFSDHGFQHLAVQAEIRHQVVVAAGASAGIGLEALPPVRKAIGSGFETKTITL